MLTVDSPSHWHVIGAVESYVRCAGDIQAIRFLVCECRNVDDDRTTVGRTAHCTAPSQLTEMTLDSTRQQIRSDQIRSDQIRSDQITCNDECHQSLTHFETATPTPRMIETS